MVNLLKTIDMSGHIVNLEEAYKIIKESSRRKVSKKEAQTLLESIGVLKSDGSFTKEYNFLQFGQSSCGNI